MNESDYLRQQLAAERAHLRQLLAALRTGPSQALAARAHYLAWATPRLLAQYGRHLDLLPGRLAARRQTLPPQAIAGISTATRAATATLAQLQAALDSPQEARLAQALAAHLAPLATLVKAWDEPLEQLAADCYRIEDWRRAAQLRADDILRERQLFAAAQA